jgi:DUF917 family protein
VREGQQQLCGLQDSRLRTLACGGALLRSDGGDRSSVPAAATQTVGEHGPVPMIALHALTDDLSSRWPPCSGLPMADAGWTRRALPALRQWATRIARIRAASVAVTDVHGNAVLVDASDDSGADGAPIGPGRAAARAGSRVVAWRAPAVGCSRRGAEATEPSAFGRHVEYRAGND